MNLAIKTLYKNSGEIREFRIRFGGRYRTLCYKMTATRVQGVAVPKVEPHGRCPYKNSARKEFSQVLFEEFFSCLLLSDWCIFGYCLCRSLLDLLSSDISGMT